MSRRVQDELETKQRSAFKSRCTSRIRLKTDKQVYNKYSDPCEC